MTLEKLTKQDLKIIQERTDNRMEKIEEKYTALSKDLMYEVSEQVYEQELERYLGERG